MQGPWHEREMEFDDSMTKGSNSNSNSNNNATLYNNLKNHHIVKPLLNGFLTAEAHALLACGLRSISDHVLKKQIQKSIIITRLKMELLLGATNMTAALGVFEILTKKYRKANNGMPLTLYQEACCGFTSGAAAAFVWQPFFMALNRVGASVISGFFSAVLGHPYNYLLQIKAGVQKQYASGDKNAYRYIPHYVSRVLGSPQFYSRFLNTFRVNVWFCVVRWWIYERVAQP